jgi:ATP-binding protein involved in chromosome partitioning
VKSYQEIAGDGGSHVAEQLAEERARVARALSGTRHLLAIGSGKGGVGKSTLTAELARAFRESGRPVAILDADLNGPSQARLAGLATAPLVPLPDGSLAPPRSALGIPVVSLGGLVPEGQAVEFGSASQGASHVWRATREFAFVGQLLGSVGWGELDFLLVDLPPGAERTVQWAEFLGPRAAFVLVTIPSPLAHSVVSRSLAALRKTPNRVLGYIENMSGYYCAGCAEVRPLFAPAGDELGLPCLGRVPFDPALSAAEAGRVGASVGVVAARLVELLAAKEEVRS